MLLGLSRCQSEGKGLVMEGWSLGVVDGLEA